ncbi:MAG: serine/threonine protein kinase [Planctomycetes bacterium]|nr:serine/threonine protein kinase [Planctomycetota bacterium]
MSVSPLAPGVQLGEWVLVSKLGEGGFGQVWRARNAEVHEMVVAIKVPTHSGLVAELRTEASLLHALVHPRIVRTITVNTRHETPYLVMELVNGPSLREVLLGCRTLPPPVAVQIARQVLEALEHAHQRQVVHRDLKPENVLLRGWDLPTSPPPVGAGSSSTPSTASGPLTVPRQAVAQSGEPGAGQAPGCAPHAESAAPIDVLLSDFGLGIRTIDASPNAQTPVLLSGALDGRATRNLLGTLAYMAPEQLRGGEADARTDLYAVGLLLHEMLTGEAGRLRFPVRGVSPRVSAVIEQATETEPARRFATACEMSSALDGDALSDVEDLGTHSLPSTATFAAQALAGALPGPPLRHACHAGGRRLARLHARLGQRRPATARTDRRTGSASPARLPQLHCARSARSPKIPARSGDRPPHEPTLRNPRPARLRLRGGLPRLLSCLRGPRSLRGRVRLLSHAARHTVRLGVRRSDRLDLDEGVPAYARGTPAADPTARRGGRGTP